jgi:hypothetical protein
MRRIVRPCSEWGREHPGRSETIFCAAQCSALALPDPKVFDFDRCVICARSRRSCWQALQQWSRRSSGTPVRLLRSGAHLPDPLPQEREE